MKKVIPLTIIITLSVAVVSIVVFLALHINLVVVDGHSMKNTLQDGDSMIVENIFYKPNRDDIVVINMDHVGFEKPIIKRIIAIEGDVIDFNFDKGEVYLNNELLDEPYIAEEMTSNREFSKFPQTVPKNHVFVMGDNRNHSMDSRRSRVGMVEQKNIIGKMFMKFSSVSSPKSS